MICICIDLYLIICIDLYLIKTQSSDSCFHHHPPGFKEDASTDEVKGAGHPGVHRRFYSGG